MLSQEFVSQIKALFETEKQRLLYSGKLVNADFAIASDDLMDEGDLTSTELETSMRMQLRNREALYLRKVEQALGRIQDGTFGECESCEEAIDPRRLMARPTANLCVNCKEVSEYKEVLHIDGHRSKSLGSRVRWA